MTPITLIVQMTGMLLITSANGANVPRHVLMPVAGDSAPPHVPQLGFKSTSTECKYNYVSGICWVSMTGWYLELGPAGSGSSSLPPEIGTITDASHRITSTMISSAPGRSIAARVTLRGGSISACSDFEYRFHGQLMPLASLVTWQTQVDPNTFSLIRHPLDPGSGAKESRIEIPRPTGTTIELFIRNAPASQTGLTLRSRHSPDSTTVGRHRRATAGGMRGVHYHAFYDLLGYPEKGRDIPIQIGPTSMNCVFAGFSLLREVPGTATCMVAAGVGP